MLNAYVCLSLSEALEHWFQRQYSTRACATQQQVTVDLEALFARPRPEVQWLLTQTDSAGFLTHSLAMRQGVVLDTRIDYFLGYIWKLIAALQARAGAPISDRSPFDPQVSVWLIYSYLEKLDPHHPDVQGIASTLSVGNPSALMSLAKASAELFSRYLVYRIDWLSAWQEGRKLTGSIQERWQAPLWRYLLEKLPFVQKQHPLLWLNEALDRLAESQQRTRILDELGLPKQMVVLGSEEIAPIYWQLLKSLSRLCDIQVYSFAICDHYHADLRSESSVIRAQLNQQAHADTAIDRRSSAELYFELGHPLLASWGSSHALQQLALQEYCDQIEESSIADTIFQRSPGQSLLRDLQLEIARLDVSDINAQADLISSPIRCDSSIKVIDCHSLSRQIQELQVLLSRWFQEDSSRTAADVLVLTTDLEQTYALLPGLWSGVPVRFGGLGRRLNPAVSAWMAEQALYAQPLTIEAVFNWLRLTPTQNNWAYGPEQLSAWQDWMIKAGVHQLEARNRAVDSDLHGLERGLERLLLGFMMDPEQARGLDRYAAVAIQEDERESLALLLQIMDHVRSEHRERYQQSKSLLDWAKVFRSGMIPGQEADEQFVQTILDVVARLEQIQSANRSAESYSYELVLKFVDELLEAGSSPTSPSGTILVTSPDRVRFQSYRLVAWLGLEDGQWPRVKQPLRIDLMQEMPRRGDPDPRARDRAVFLEHLMQTRECLWLFFSGRDLRQSSPLNPSSMVSQLCEHLQSRLDPKSGGFNLINEAPLFATWQDAAIAQANSKAAPIKDWPLMPHFEPGLNGALECAAVDADLPLQRIKSWLKHPTRYFAQHILGFRTTYEQESPEQWLPWLLAKRDWSDLQVQAFHTSGLHADHPQLAPGAGRLAQLKLLQSKVAQVEADLQAQGLGIEQISNLRVVGKLNWSVVAELIHDGVFEGVQPQLLDLESGKRHALIQDPEQLDAIRKKLLAAFAALHTRGGIPSPPLLFKYMLLDWTTIQQKGKKTMEEHHSGLRKELAKYWMLDDGQENSPNFTPKDSDDVWVRWVWRGHELTADRIIDNLFSDFLPLQAAVQEVE